MINFMGELNYYKGEIYAKLSTNDSTNAKNSKRV